VFAYNFLSNYKLISLIFVLRKQPVTGKIKKILAYKKSLLLLKNKRVFKICYIYI